MRGPRPLSMCPPRRPHALPVALALTSSALLFAAALGVAHVAEAADGKKPTVVDRHDPENVTSLSVYMEMLANGADRYAAKDYRGALDLFTRAIPLAPRDPRAHLLAGETHLAMNALADAEASFRAAEQAADGRTAAGVRQRSYALFAIADVLERQKKWSEARAAWQTYGQHAARAGDAGVSAAPGEARVTAIQKVLDLEKAYVAVRERIAAEKDGGASKK